MIILYPDQFGEPQEIVSFSDPRGHNESQHYEKVGKWFYKWLKKTNGKIRLATENGTPVRRGKMERIRNAHVLVVGLGGVGAYAAEMICRAGVGRMTIVDADTVQPTNMNRQLPAMHSTLGRTKAEVLAARYKDINPAIELTVLPVT